MKISDIRGLSLEALANKEKDLAEEFFKLKFQHGIRPLEDSSKLSALRREIAQVKTVITEKGRSVE